MFFLDNFEDVPIMTIESDGESEFCLPFNQTEELESTICTYVRPRPLSGKKNKVFGTILSLKTEYNFIEAGKASFFLTLSQFQSLEFVII